jgi:hypothetical protein
MLRISLVLNMLVFEKKHSVDIWGRLGLGNMQDILSSLATAMSFTANTSAKAVFVSASGYKGI